MRWRGPAASSRRCRPHTSTSSSCLRLSPILSAPSFPLVFALVLALALAFLPPVARACKYTVLEDGQSTRGMRRGGADAADEGGVNALGACAQSRWNLRKFSLTVRREGGVKQALTSES
jgi:hypothetical protein